MGQDNQTSPNLNSQQYQPQPYGYQQQQPQQNYQQQPQQPYVYQQGVPQQQQPVYVYQQQQPQQQYEDHKSPLLGSQHQNIEVFHDPHQKFPESPKYQDKMFHILFYVNLVVVAALYMFMLTRDKIQYYYYSEGDSVEDSAQGYNTSEDYSLTILGLAGLGVVYGFIFIFVWMKLASKYPKQLITYTFVGNMVLTAILIIICIVYQQYIGAVIFAIFLVITLIFFYLWRKRIEFTGTLLANTTHLLHHFPGAYRVAYGSLLVSMVWLTLWGLTYQRLYLVYTDTAFYGISIYLVFSLYWVSYVIKNTVHVTICGLFSSWYFLAGTQMGIPKNPTLGALKRSLTTSFGSICFGSLLLAIISTLRYMANLLQNSKNAVLQIVGCFLNCILGLMQSILAFFNVYTFTQVAIYGKSYCDAAKDTVDLFQHRLGSIIINDDFISVCLNFSAFLGALMGGIFGGLVTYFIYGSAFGAWFVLIVCYLVITMALEIVYSGVVALFVCYLMDPEVLKNTKPEIYNLYNSTYKIK